MEDLKKRQWPIRMLCRFENMNIFHPGCCNSCNKPIEKWEGEYFGTFSDCCTLYDFEYSYFTGYCEECAKREAETSRKANHPICQPVIEHVDNIRDEGFFCERKVYADGMVVESSADGYRYAMAMNK